MLNIDSSNLDFTGNVVSFVSVGGRTSAVVLDEQVMLVEHQTGPKVNKRKNSSDRNGLYHLQGNYISTNLSFLI